MFRLLPCVHDTALCPGHFCCAQLLHCIQVTVLCSGYCRIFTGSYSRCVDLAERLAPALECKLSVRATEELPKMKPEYTSSLEGRKKPTDVHTGGSAVGEGG